MRYFILLLTSIIGIISCNDSHQTTSFVIDGYDAEVNETITNFNDINIIPLELTEHSLLNGINKILYYDSYYLIQDYSSVLYRFDANGKFLNRISMKGRGNKEYLRLNSFCVNSLGQVLLFDSFQDHILYYTLNGEFIKDIHLPQGSLYEMQDVIMLSNDKVLLQNYIIGDYNEVYTIVDLNTGEKNVIYESPMKTEGVGQYIGKHTMSDFHEVKCILPFDNSIYTIDAKNTLDALLTVNTKQKKPRRKLLAAQTNFSIETYVELSKHGYFQGFTNMFETSKYYLFTFFESSFFLVDKSNLNGTLFTNDNLNFPIINLRNSTDSLLIGYLDEQTIMFYPELEEYYSEQYTNPSIILYNMK